MPTDSIEQGRSPEMIPGFETASALMRRHLADLIQLGPVRSIGPGRWLATCPCCGEIEGAEVVDVWAGAEFAERVGVQ